MIRLSFTLTMPSVGSWNGRWTGEDNLYAKIRSFREAPQVAGQPLKRRYTYSFGDGWVAAVDVKEVTIAEAKKLEKASRGFCGYDWMIDSILQHNEIRA